MNSPSIRPTLTLAQIQHRAGSAASQLTATVLRLDGLGDSAESLLAEGADIARSPALDPFELSQDDLENLVALRRELAADFAELLLENFDVEPEPGNIEIIGIPQEYQVRILPASELDTPLMPGWTEQHKLILGDG